jgi:hypothetical protein
MIRVVPTTIDHLVVIADDVRDVDAYELKLFTGMKPLEALCLIFDTSQKKWTILHGDRPAVFFGCNVTNVLFKTASPFMIATNYAAGRPRLFAKVSREAQKAFEGHFLINYVLASNASAIKWLKWLGFTLGPLESYNGIATVRRFVKDYR